MMRQVRNLKVSFKADLSLLLYRALWVSEKYRDLSRIRRVTSDGGMSIPPAALLLRPAFFSCPSSCYIPPASRSGTDQCRGQGWGSVACCMWNIPNLVSMFSSSYRSLPHSNSIHLRAHLSKKNRTQEKNEESEKEEKEKGERKKKHAWRHENSARGTQLWWVPADKPAESLIGGTQYPRPGSLLANTTQKFTAPQWGRGGLRTHFCFLLFLRMW